MPEKFSDMVEMFAAATEDEVFPAYKPEERQGVEVRVCSSFVVVLVCCLWCLSYRCCRY